MSNKAKIKKIMPYLVLAISFVAFIAVSTLYIIPSVRTILSTRQKTQEAKNLLENELKPKLSVLTSQDAVVLGDNFKLALTALPEESNSLGLMNSLERIGKAYGVELQGISYAQPVSAAAVTASNAAKGLSQTFSIATNADYSTIMALIKGFENLLPINSVSAIRFARGLPGSGSLAFSFTVDFFYLPPPTSTTGLQLSGLTDSEKESLISVQRMQDYPLVPVYVDPGKDNPFQ